MRNSFPLRGVRIREARRELQTGRDIKMFVVQSFWLPYTCVCVCVCILSCNWSSAASACNSLKWDFGSWPDIAVWPPWWECWILATRLVVSNKAMALQLCKKRIPTKTESSETSQVLIGRKRVHYVRIDTWVGSESCTLMVVWITFMGISSRFPLANFFFFLNIYLFICLC